MKVLTALRLQSTCNQHSVGNNKIVNNTNKMVFFFSYLLSSCFLDMRFEHGNNACPDELDNEIGDLGMYPPSDEELRAVQEDARRHRVDVNLARGRAFERHFA